jgi:hypothetical protein
MTALAQAMSTKRKARSSAQNASTIRPQHPLPKLSPVEEEALLGGHNRCLKCVWHPAGSKHTCDPEQGAVRLKGMRSDPRGVGAPPQAITSKGGHRQQPGVDFNETFAPVCSYRSVRMMLAVAAREGLHLRQFDIQNAFLHGHLGEEGYIWPPKGSGWRSWASAAFEPCFGRCGLPLHGSSLLA